MNTALPFARKRKGLTNYRKRLALLKGNLPRAVVRKSLRNVTIQIVTRGLLGDNVIFAADSKELPKYGWGAGGGNLPAAYLTGYLLGLRAKKTVHKAVLDIGLHVSTKGARVYAALKGMLDAGLQIPHNEEVLPDHARLTGKHIQSSIEKDVNAAKEKVNATHG